VGILPERDLNNGQPSLHAALIVSAGPQVGDHVVHVGAGLGYCTAILDELVGPVGAVTAIEFDPALAARAAANLSGVSNVCVIPGDGTRIAFSPADVIYVNAGATRPPDAWLDRLKEGGRLVLPLTTDQKRGVAFRFERRGPEFLVQPISEVEFFPCKSARDRGSEAAMAAALDNGRWREVTRLYRHGDLPAECWLRAPSWCLTYH
jgi:protein-L-isoaspartate(D-aspartate) O-methyltransferase